MEQSLRAMPLAIPKPVSYPPDMNEKLPLPRSPLLMSADDTALLVVDVQDKLVGLLSGHEQLIWNIRRLLDAARVCGVRVLATEQYPAGLGPTTQVLAERLEQVASKTRFSCGGCPDLFTELPQQGVRKILVVGIETHVCVLQTTLDLLTAGFDVYLAVDAIGARFDVDHHTALRRMELAGAVLATTESAMFEWCEDSSQAQFKSLSQLVREAGPVNG